MEEVIELDKTALAAERKEFHQQLRSLVFPIAIQTFMTSLVSATDALMLGLLDQTSLSSVSLAGQIQFVFSMFVLGLSAGTGIMTAQYWGKKDAENIQRVIPVPLRWSLLGGAICTLLAAFTPRLLMLCFTDAPELVAAGSSYLRTVSLSYFIFGISQIYEVILRNTGHAKQASRIASSAVVVNIILNAILIFGLFGAPKLGIVGAAIATVCARLFELCWAVIENLRPERVRISWNRLLKKVNKDLQSDFWRYTIPMLGAALVWGIAFSLYSVIMGHMGSDAVAANSITSIAKSMVSCFIRGVSSGAGILVGNLLGANELAKAKRYGARLVKMAALTGFITALVLWIASPFIVHIAPLSETAKNYLQWMLLFCGLNIMAQSLNTTILDGIFGAGGDSKFDMTTNIWAMWCFTVPVGFLAAFLFKLPPVIVYCIVNLDEIVKLWAVFVRYRKYIWVRNITRDNITD
ncbi:MAG: MATE family efflux transporter [Treponemataceae bacterium]|nr:MATE family efflux transporter [Treponemataceae bacterium]